MCLATNTLSIVLDIDWVDSSTTESIIPAIHQIIDFPIDAAEMLKSTSLNEFCKACDMHSDLVKNNSNYYKYIKEHSLINFMFQLPKTGTAQKMKIASSAIGNKSNKLEDDVIEQIDKIVSHRGRKLPNNPREYQRKTLRFMVRWKGKTEKDDTEVGLKELLHVNQFHSYCRSNRLASLIPAVYVKKNKKKTESTSTPKNKISKKTRNSKRKRYLDDSDESEEDEDGNLHESEEEYSPARDKNGRSSARVSSSSNRKRIVEDSEEEFDDDDEEEVRSEGGVECAPVEVLPENGAELDKKSVPMSRMVGGDDSEDAVGSDNDVEILVGVSGNTGIAESSMETEVCVEVYESYSRDTNTHSHTWNHIEQNMNSSCNSVPIHGSGDDVILNVGAPVWCVAWNKPLSNTTTQVYIQNNPNLLSHLYLAVGTTVPSAAYPMASYNTGHVNDMTRDAMLRSMRLSEGLEIPSDATDSSGGVSGGGPMGREGIYIVGDAVKHPNIVQIWKYNAGMRRSEMAFGIGLVDSGPVWGLQWCPIPGDKHKPGNVLGLLAVVCGNGKCMVFIVPSEDKVRDGNDMSSSKNSDSGPLIVSSSDLRCWEVSANVPDIMQPELVGVDTKREAPLITCASWLYTHMDSDSNCLIACGLSDGAWGIWELPFTNGIADWDCEGCDEGNTIFVPEPKMLFQDMQMDTNQPCRVAVTCVVPCPYKPGLVATGNYSGIINVWSFRDTLVERTRPIFSRRHLVNGWIYDIVWEHNGLGLFYSCSDNSGVCWEPLWCDSEQFKKTLYTHQQLSGCVWKLTGFSYNGMMVIGSVGSDGSVYTGFVSNLSNRRRSNNKIYRHHYINKIKTNSLETIDCQMYVELCAPNGSIAGQYAGNDAFLSPPKVSVRGIDSIKILCPLNEKNQKVLLAYGGSAGYVRIQHWNICK